MRINSISAHPNTIPFPSSFSLPLSPPFPFPFPFPFPSKPDNDDPFLKHMYHIFDNVKQKVASIFGNFYILEIDLYRYCLPISFLREGRWGKGREEGRGRREKEGEEKRRNGEGENGKKEVWEVCWVIPLWHIQGQSIHS